MATGVTPPPTLKRRKGETPEEAHKRHHAELNRWWKEDDLKDLRAETKSLKRSVGIVEGLLKRARPEPAVRRFSPAQQKDLENFIASCEARLEGISDEIGVIDKDLGVLDKEIARVSEGPEEGLGSEAASEGAGSP